MNLTDAIGQAIASVDFGKPAARKSGRNPRWPYVAVIAFAGQGGRPQTTTLRGLAFATREEALARAERQIDADRAALARKLADPCQRALREYHGLPRNLG